MAINDKDSLKLAVKRYKKAFYNPKTPVKTLRNQYDALFSTRFLPNKVDRKEVEGMIVPGEFLIPEFAIGKKTIVYAHGGGFISGSRASYRNLCASLAHECACKLLLAEYRLAPEYPFPTPLEDVYSAYSHAISLGIRPRDIILAGDGAGANLALSLVHYLRSKRLETPSGVIALSPWVNLNVQGSPQKKNPDPFLSRETLTLQALQYTWQDNFTNPHVSPIFGDFTAFPPVYIQCGSEEILADDAKQLAETIESAQSPCVLDIEDGMWHLFQHADDITPRAHVAVKRIGNWVRTGMECTKN